MVQTETNKRRSVARDDRIQSSSAERIDRKASGLLDVSEIIGQIEMAEPADSIDWMQIVYRRSRRKRP